MVVPVINKLRSTIFNTNVRSHVNSECAVLMCVFSSAGPTTIIGNCTAFVYMLFESPAVRLIYYIRNTFTDNNSFR